jgi:cytochrome c-type biogenesis protein CcmH
VAGLALVGILSAAGSHAAAPVGDEQVAAIARELRCVVCQNLSVADSPSEMAGQMRELIRGRLAAGDTPEQVRAYFVDRYGEWVLLAPPARGLNLILWLAPFAAVIGGLTLVLVLSRRWRRQPAASAPAAMTPALGAGERERIASELERLRD